MVLDFKTFLKEEWVRVVPFAKYQITVGPGLKQNNDAPTTSRGSLAALVNQTNDTKNFDHFGKNGKR